MDEILRDSEFLAKIARGAIERTEVSGDCLVYIGYRNPAGYGCIKATRCGIRKNIYVHRLIYQVSHGPIPDGMCVMHKCDNTSCCNINHLTLGTLAQNNEDMRQKGRDRYYYGELSNLTTLTDAQVEEIRARVGNGESQASVARSLGIDNSTVNKIYHGHSRRYRTSLRGKHDQAA